MDSKVAVFLLRISLLLGLILAGLFAAGPSWADTGHSGAQVRSKALGDPGTLAAGDSHTCTITDSGTVKCWGYNVNGQLGNGSFTSSSTPVTVSGISDATALAAGEGHTCALTGGGTVKCWGKNASGQLGNGSTTQSSTPVTVSDISDATELAAGNSHTCALTGGGTVKCWGYNVHGQLGNGSFTGSSTPVTVSGISDATALATRSSHTCALTGGGTVECWGYNYYGQLGNGEAGFYTTPQDVIGSPFLTFFQLTYTSGANGSLSGDVSQTVAAGADGTPVTALPDIGYHFTEWDDASTENPRTDTAIAADISVIASFAIDQFSVTASAVGNGSITPALQSVDYGSTASFTAIPDANHHVLSVTGDSCTPIDLGGGSWSASNITAPCAVTATFAIDQFTLAYSAGPHGTITGINPQVVDYGSSGLPVSAVADIGYHFVQWSDGSTANPRTDTNVTANLSVSASFAINTYVVTATSSGHGAITPASQMIDHGEMASLEVTPEAGYAAAVSGDTCALSPTTGSTWISTAIEADCQVTATFTLIPVPVLEIAVDDNQNFARYGSLLNYIVTVTNVGSADAANVSLANSVPAQIDAAFTTWICIGAGNGASCPASGTGNLDSTAITLPAGRSLYWLVTAPVHPQATGETVEYVVDAQLSTAETVSDSDIDTLVIYRGGFDAPHEDGGNVVEPVLNDCGLDAPFATFDDASVWTFSPSAMTATHPIQVFATALDSSAMGIRIEQSNMERTPRIRIVTVARDGSQRASAWVDAGAGTPLALTTIDLAQGGRAVILVGANEPLEFPLPAGIAETLQIRAPSSANAPCQ